MTQTVQSLRIQEKKLANEATLLYLHAPGAPRLAMSYYLPGGNLLDSTAGLSDVVDRLLTKGTKTRSQEEISTAIDSLTLELDIETKRDYSAIHTTLLEEDLDASLDLVADIYYNATLDEFEREKEKLAGEIQMDLDSPKSRASDQLVRTIFQDTAYSTVSSLIQENLPKMTSVEEANTYYRRAYQPDGMIVAVAGDIPVERVEQRIESTFTRGNGHARGLLMETENRLMNHWLEDSQYVTFARDDSSQAHILKGWLFPHVNDVEYYPLVVMNTILGAAGLSSRLFLELRDKQGLAYNVRSTYETYRHKGLFYLYIGTEPHNKERCLDGFRIECEKLMNEKVSEKELEDAKRNILGRRAVFLETAPQQANYIGVNYAVGRSPRDIEELPDRINAVTAEEIRQAAQTWLSKPSVTSVVGPSAIL